MNYHAIRMRRPWARAADRVSSQLLSGTPQRGPSAVAVGVSEGEHEPFTLARGHARVLGDVGHLEHPVPLVEEPVFDVGSVTKVVVTSALVMTLADRGRLRLDTPVAHWLDGFSGAGKDAVTVRDLLEHQGGLWEWWPTYCAEPPAEAAELLQSLPLRYEPGSGRHYSDLGFLLLGEIIARELGEKLAVAARREVFEPLGLGATGYRAAGAPGAADRVAATSRGDWYEKRMLVRGSPYPVPVSSDAFTGWRTHVLVGEANDGNCWHGFGGVAGHAGLFTTAQDLLLFGRALLASIEGTGPWSTAVVEAFLRPGRDPCQGLGFRVTRGDTGVLVGHPGFPGAHFAIAPDRRRVVVLLTNRLHTSGEPRPVDAAWSQLLKELEGA